MTRSFFLLAMLFATTAQAADEPAFKAGRLVDPAIGESSGIVASRARPGVFWTHNDSGNHAELFAIDRVGKLLRTYRVDARNIDWEDIAMDDKAKLYIADIGNNRRDRREIFVHALAEPDPTKDFKVPAPLKVEQTWTLTYPNGKAFDAESLFVVGGKGYVISKLLNFSKAGLYSFEIDPAKPKQVLTAVGELPVRVPVTAADVSADGKWLAVLTVGGPYLFRIDGDLTKAFNMDPKHVTFASPNMEACTIVDEGLLVTTERRDVFLFRWKDFGLKAE